MENKQKYQIHQSYPFDTYRLVELDGKVHLIVSDEKDLFKVMPYDFQVKKGQSRLPKTIYCYVKAINDFGKPMLTLSRKEILEELFQEMEKEYSFTILRIQQDFNSGWVYYEMVDEHGVKHRYYPKDDETKHKQGDSINLYLKGIEEKPKNKAHLNLVNPESVKLSPLGSVVENNFGIESEVLEFKRSIVFTSEGIADIDTQLTKIVRVIAGFMNKEGGRLLIGLRNNGQVQGIESDFIFLNSSKLDTFVYPENMDGYELKIRHAVKFYLGASASGAMAINFHQVGGKQYVEVKVEKMLRPVYFEQEKIYQRAGNTTQQLKGEDITWFVYHRLMLLSHGSSDLLNSVNKTLAGKPTHAGLMDTDIFSDPRISFLEESNKKSLDDIWAYFTFYKNGYWSFQPQPQHDADVLHQIAIAEDMKKSALLMVYDNGKINAVVPEQMIYSLGKSGKVFKYPKRRYKNGWNTSARLEKLILAKSQDALLIVSFDQKGKTLYKIHEAGHIGINSLFNCEGNVVVNKRLGGTLLDVLLLEEDDAASLHPYRMKKEQTSSTLGLPGDESIYSDRVSLAKQ